MESNVENLDVQNTNAIADILSITISGQSCSYMLTRDYIPTALEIQTLYCLGSVVTKEKTVI